MRTAKILAVMMLCAAVPAATNAQSTLTSVMDDFVKSHSNKEVKTATYLEYDENDSSDTRKPSTFHYEYDFNLPATDNKKIDKQISEINAEIRNLEQSIKTKTVITHLVNMLDYCGEDTSAITNDPRVSNISMIASEIHKERENIKLLQKQKKS